MNLYKTSKSTLPGSNFREIRKNADKVLQKIRKNTKRKPFIRSKYFKKEKIFLNLFWQHLFGKHQGDRTRRIKYMGCAIDLIKNSVLDPSTKENPNNRSELLHRFSGITKNKDIFHVQIKENKRTGRKDLISIFPEK